MNPNESKLSHAEPTSPVLEQEPDRGVGSSAWLGHWMEELEKPNVDINAALGEAIRVFEQRLNLLSEAVESRFGK